MLIASNSGVAGSEGSEIELLNKLKSPFWKLLNDVLIDSGIGIDTYRCKNPANETSELLRCPFFVAQMVCSMMAYASKLFDVTPSGSSLCVIPCLKLTRKSPMRHSGAAAQPETIGMAQHMRK